MVEDDLAIVEPIIEPMDRSIFRETYPIADMVLELDFDELINSDFVKVIPILRSLSSIYKGVIGVRDRFFMKKVALFIKQYNSGLNTEEIHNFVSEVLTDEHFRKNVNEKILVLLDRFDDELKALILSELMINWIKRNIDWETFKRVSYFVDRAPSSVFLILYDAYANLDTDPPDSETATMNFRALALYYPLILGSGLAGTRIGELGAQNVSKDAICICKYGLKNLFDSQYQSLTRDIVESLKEKTKTGERLLNDPIFSEYERRIIEQGSQNEIFDFKIRTRILEKIRRHYSI